MRTQIESYILDHTNAWSLSTQKTEKCRLLVLADQIDGNPDRLWKALDSYKPYTRATIWTRVTKFWGWLRRGEVNPYQLWREKNAKVFKYVYQRKTPEISIEVATALIATLRDPAVRRKASELLSAGLRWTESFSLCNGLVVGKGGKPRAVHTVEIEGPVFTGHHSTFWRALAEIGLKPHDLRKIRATDLARKGMDIQTLCSEMGWSDPKTAMSYISPLSRKEREKFYK